MRLLRLLAALVFGIAGFVLAFVVLAPDAAVRLLAARAAAWSGIEAKGLDTLDLSLTQGRISGGPLSFGEGEGPPAKVGRFRLDLDAGALLSGRAVVEDLVLADVDAELAVDGAGGVKLNGIPLGSSADRGTVEETPEKDAARLPAIDVKRASLEQVRLDLRRGPGRSFPLLLDHLRLTDLSAETPDLPASFDVAGSASEARFGYSGELKPYRQPFEAVLDGGFENLSLKELEALAGPLGLSRAEGRLAAQGKHRLTLAEAGQEITNEGTLTATGIDVALPGSDAVRLDRADLRLYGSATIGPGGRVEFSNRAPWAIAGLMVAWSESGAVRVAEATLDLDVSGSLTPGAGGAFKVRGRVPLRGHVVAWSDTGDVRLDDGMLRVDIDVTADPHGAMRIVGPMALQGGSGGVRSGESFRLSYRGIDADFPDADIDLAADGTARVEGRPVATFAGFDLAAPLPLRATTAVATSKLLHVLSPAEGVSVEFRGGLELREAAARADEARELRAQTLAFEFGQMRYDEDAHGAAKLGADIAARAAAVRMEGKDAKPFPLRDGTLTLAGLDLALTPDGGIRRLALADETQAVLEGVARGRPHHLSLGLDRFEIADLDPGVPDQLTKADIVVTVNQTGRIELSERVKPFIRPPEFLFTGGVRDLELPQLSPYVAAVTGFNVESGRFNATGRATAENGKLDGVVDLDIQTLELVPAVKKGDALERDLIGVPVDLAIALLENAKRQIVVSLPFSGDLSHPEVDYCDVIRTALLGAVRLVVTAVVPGAGSKGQPNGMQPVPFDPGSTALRTDAAGQLDRTGAMLAQKPRLRLQVCGRATAADAKALAASPGAPAQAAADLSAKLLALAQERSRVAAARISAVAGVRADQVQECRPTADATDAGAGRADVRF